MKILALEISSALGSVALLEDDREPDVFEFPSDRKHSGTFFHCLERFSARFSGLNSIVVGLGPGSYAGVRIAIGAAIGLQAAHGLQLLGLPSICALSDGASEYCVVGDARRQSYFFAHVRGSEIIEGIDLCDEEDLRARLKKLDQNMPVYSCEVLAQFAQVSVRYPSALVLAQLIQRSTIGFSRAPLEPIYLRTPYITVPKTAA